MYNEENTIIIDAVLHKCDITFYPNVISSIEQIDIEEILSIIKELIFFCLALWLIRNQYPLPTTLHLAKGITQTSSCVNKKLNMISLIRNRIKEICSVVNIKYCIKRLPLDIKFTFLFAAAMILFREIALKYDKGPISKTLTRFTDMQLDFCYSAMSFIGMLTFATMVLHKSSITKTILITRGFMLLFLVIQLKYGMLDFKPFATELTGSKPTTLNGSIYQLIYTVLTPLSILIYIVVKSVKDYGRSTIKDTLAAIESNYNCTYHSDQK